MSVPVLCVASWGRESRPSSTGVGVGVRGEWWTLPRGQGWSGHEKRVGQGIEPSVPHRDSLRVVEAPGLRCGYLRLRGSPESEVEDPKGPLGSCV